MRYQYEIVENQRISDGFLKLHRYRLRHELFEGGQSRLLVRERLERLRAAFVLLYDPWLDKVVWVEQFRIGALGQLEHPWILEPVGGYIEEGETPEQVAVREAQEEAGCQVTALEKICDFLVSPGLSVDRIHLYCGRVDASHAAGVHGLDHEGEDIRVVVQDASEAIAGMYQAVGASTSYLIALQWLAMHREELRERWR